MVPVGGYVSQRGRQHEVKVNGVPQAEYEGLHTGELAWIKSGRRDGGTSAFRYGHDTNRMQRLASTPWVEGYFEAHMSDKTIALHTLDVKPDNPSTNNPSINSLLHTYRGFVDKGMKSVLNLTDVVSAKDGRLLSEDGKTYNVKAERAASGISALEKGPFLRGLQELSELAEIPDRTKEPRNLSDMLAISALEDALKQEGLMDWTPDGIIASKYEAPAGDYAASAELDASSGQLFNLAVQGPSISKTWTSSLGQHRQKCHPLDKVFICMVADLTWRNADGMRPDGDVTAYTSDVKKIIELKRLADKQTLSKEQKAELDDAQTRMQEREKWSNGNQIAMLAGNPKQAWLSNFRLKRCTSAYLAAYSGWNAAASQGSPKDTTQRLGLAYTMPFEPEDGVLEGMASYIVGAWCVGTVLDSAASRAQVGQLVRTNPTSMALSVYVNIEWWSGDKLHRHYMDKGNDEATLARGEKRKREDMDKSKERLYLAESATKPTSSIEDMATAVSEAAEAIRVLLFRDGTPDDAEQWGLAVGTLQKAEQRAQQYFKGKFALEIRGHLSDEAGRLLRIVPPLGNAKYMQDYVVNLTTEASDLKVEESELPTALTVALNSASRVMSSEKYQSARLELSEVFAIKRRILNLEMELIDYEKMFAPVQLRYPESTQLESLDTLLKPLITLKDSRKEEEYLAMNNVLKPGEATTQPLENIKVLILEQEKKWKESKPILDARYEEILAQADKEDERARELANVA